MSTQKILGAAPVLVILAAATASAQEARDLPPAERTPVVSELHGQLVPVGQHNEYLYAHPRYNLSANPIGWVLGSYGVSASYAFHENVAVRADVAYYSPPGADIDGYEIGVGVPIYFRRVYSGAFLEPGAIIRELGPKDADGERETQVGPQVLFGWHWIWDSGLNVSMAFGFGRNTSKTASDSSSEVFANGYLRFGYAF
jgi:hypothetical protein